MKMLRLLLLTPLCAVGSPPQYTVHDLGPVQQVAPGGGLYWRMVETASAPDLPSLGGDPALNAVYIFYPDFYVGTSPLADTVTRQMHAALWKGRTVADLGVLPGAGPSFGPRDEFTYGPNSAAYAANSVGEIVGSSDSAFRALNLKLPASHAVLWSHGVPQDLGSIAGDQYSSVAEGVNDSHEIVGSTNTISRIDGTILTRAFVYIAGTMYNLTFFLSNGSTIRLYDALSINCQGDIAALGYDANVAPIRSHSYLLTRNGVSRRCAQ